MTGLQFNAEAARRQAERCWPGTGGTPPGGSLTIADAPHAAEAHAALAVLVRRQLCRLRHGAGVSLVQARMPAGEGSSRGRSKARVAAALRAGWWPGLPKDPGLLPTRRDDRGLTLRLCGERRLALGKGRGLFQSPSEITGALRLARGQSALGLGCTGPRAADDHASPSPGPAGAAAGGRADHTWRRVLTFTTHSMPETPWHYFTTSLN